MSNDTRRRGLDQLRAQLVDIKRRIEEAKRQAEELREQGASALHTDLVAVAKPLHALGSEVGNVIDLLDDAIWADAKAEGRTYKWYAADGSPLGRAPSPDGFPELPVTKR